MKVFFLSLLLSTVCSKHTNCIDTRLFHNIYGQTQNDYNNDTEYDTINIPIVWHIIYYNDDQNIADNQLESQIRVLNKDFNLQNTDRFNTPGQWQDLMASFNLNFYTDKIIRKHTNKYEWNVETQYNEMKFNKYSGSDAIDTHNKLNIWVVNFATLQSGYTLLGYAQFPTDFINHRNTDGVVLDYKATGTHGYLYIAHSLGRTATHEIGHWLNLKHIWGEPIDSKNYTDGCLFDDKVDDTPISQYPHFQNIGYPNTESCGSSDMFMNHMDYGNDSTGVMFTKGQMLRSRSIFEKDNVRYGFVKNGYKPPNNDYDDTWYIIFGVLTIFSVFFLTILIFRSLIKCLILKYQLREMNRIEEVSPEELLT